MKKIIQNTFINLYIKKQYNHVYVNDICTEAGIGRSTFYRYYKNINEILSDLETNVFNFMNNTVNKYKDYDVYILQNDDLPLNIIEIFEFILSNKNLFLCFFQLRKNPTFIKKGNKITYKRMSDVYKKYFFDENMFNLFSTILFDELLYYSTYIINNNCNYKNIAIIIKNHLKDYIDNQSKYFS